MQTCRISEVGIAGREIGQQEQLVLNTTNAARETMILVVISGGAMGISFSRCNLKICNILWVGYLGQDGGDALIDIIFG